MTSGSSGCHKASEIAFSSSMSRGAGAETGPLTGSDLVSREGDNRDYDLSRSTGGAQDAGSLGSRWSCSLTLLITLLLMTLGKLTTVADWRRGKLICGRLSGGRLSERIRQRFKAVRAVVRKHSRTA